jgi:hypothetical protein
LKGGIYVFQEFFQGKDFDSTLKVLQFLGISLCHWVIIFLIINCEFYIYIISRPLHGQVELQFDSQMDPSKVSKGISLDAQL